MLDDDIGLDMPTMDSASSYIDSESASPASSSSIVLDSPGKSTAESSTSLLKKDEEECLICGDRASGYHYNALSCEGCKGFFRRSVTRGANYVCKYNGDCKMDMWMRRKCPSCRLRICQEVGMRKECLLSAEQCKARMSRRKPRPAKPSHEEVSNTETLIAQYETRPLELICDRHKELIQRLVVLQDEYEIPKSEGDTGFSKQIEESIIKSRVSTGNVRDDYIFKEMCRGTLNAVRLVVEFSKQLPGFQDLIQEDQISLLQGCSSEIMMLRSARRYHLPTQCIVFPDGAPYTREHMRAGGLGDFSDMMFDFCHKMGSMYTDNSEYALITAICLFSERPFLQERLKIAKIQEGYAETLQAYVDAKFGKGSRRFARLLVTLTGLRTLSEAHVNQLNRFKMDMPPLLTEFFLHS